MKKSFAINSILFLAAITAGNANAKYLPEKRELPSGMEDCIKEAEELARSKAQKVNDCLRDAIPIGQEGKGLPTGPEMDECLLSKFANVWEILEPPFTGPICTEVQSKFSGSEEEDELIKLFEPIQGAINVEQGAYFEKLIGEKPGFLEDSD